MATTHETSTTQGSPGSQSGQDTRQMLKDDLSQAAQNVKGQAGAQLDHYKDSAADQLENLAHNAESAAQNMQDNDTLGLSGYVADAAGRLTGLADNLRNKNAEQLLHEAGRLARDNPLLFLAGSVALGLGLSRLFKAATPTADPTLSLDPTYRSPHHDTLPHEDAISPSTLAAEEMVATHPHDNDVLHSARPGTGIPDRQSGSHHLGDLDDGLPGSSSSHLGHPGGNR